MFLGYLGKIALVSFQKHKEIALCSFRQFHHVFEKN